MPVLLPLLCFAALVALAAQSGVFDGWRSALLIGALCWGTLTTGIIELLSLFKLLNVVAVSIAWLISLMLVLLWIVKVKRARQNHASASRPRLNPTRSELILLSCVGLLVVMIGVIAWTAPPNNVDSMTYHMGRIIHWMQNRTVAFYPTNIPRQLHQNPGSEFAILNFQILSGSDRLANFVQWFSMIGSIVGVSLIAKELGGDRRGQILAAIGCATIPMGILQGSTTQNDYAVSFWLVCFTYFVSRFLTTPRVVYSIAVGAGLGLAILTKATAYIYAFPFLVWICLSLLRRLNMRKLQLLGFIFFIVLLINVGHYTRNYGLYGSPLGPTREAASAFAYTNDVHSVAAIVSNLSRNIGLHLGTPSSKVNYYLEAAIFKLHGLINIALNDPRTTWSGTAFHVYRPVYQEDIAGNPIHLLINGLVLLLFLFQRPIKSRALLYMLSVISGVLLFCIALRWQPWNSRLHLPVFVLFTPFAATVISRLKMPWLANAAGVLLLATTPPWLLYNQARPILGRDSVFVKKRNEQYFANVAGLAQPYNQAAQGIAALNCWNVGLFIRGDDLEYPLWILLREKEQRDIHLEHVAVSDISAKYTDSRYSSFTPCAVFKIDPAAPDTIEIQNVVYSTWSSHSLDVRVYVPNRAERK